MRTSALLVNQEGRLAGKRRRSEGAVDRTRSDVLANWERSGQRILLCFFSSGRSA